MLNARSKKKVNNVLIDSHHSHLTSNSTGITSVKSYRINKALVILGFGSRRWCEQLVKANMVKVNQQLAKLHTIVYNNDYVMIGNDTRQLCILENNKIIIYNKRVGELVTKCDPQKRVTVFSNIPELIKDNYIAVGRLDYNTSGLLVFMTDGNLANYLMHPRYNWQREYLVRVHGDTLTKAQLNTIMNKGIKFAGVYYQVSSIVIHRVIKNNSWYKLVLLEGKTHEVRNIFSYYGLTVNRLIRTRFGPFLLPRNLYTGEYYQLSQLEVNQVSALLEGKGFNVNKVR